MRRGLVASYLAAGALLLGGCDSGVEYHKGDLSDGTFELRVERTKDGDYLSTLNTRSSDNSKRSVVKSVGAPIYSSDDFTVISMDVYKDEEWRKYRPLNLPDGARLTGLLLELEIIFSRNGGQRSMMLSSGSDYRHVLSHMEECDGKRPCRVPKKK